MPTLGMAKMERLGSAIGLALNLDFSRGPQPLDWPHLIERVLPHHGYHFYPVDRTEIDGDEAATDPTGGPGIDILIDRDIYDSLWDTTRRGNRARATAAHEFAHAIIHVPVIRRAHRAPHGELLLRRVRRDTLKPFNDPEWQAWALAGCIVAPRAAIASSAHLGLSELADAFGISSTFLASHARRLKMNLPGMTPGSWRAV